MVSWFHVHMYRVFMLICGVVEPWLDGSPAASDGVRPEIAANPLNPL